LIVIPRKLEANSTAGHAVAIHVELVHVQFALGFPFINFSEANHGRRVGRRNAVLREL
jgi:hypothetical protein